MFSARTITIVTAIPIAAFTPLAQDRDQVIHESLTIPRPEGMDRTWGPQAVFDGQTIVVCGSMKSYQDEVTASAFFYERNAETNEWQHVTTISLPPGSSEHFTGAAIDGDVVVLADMFADKYGRTSGLAYIVERTNGIWSLHAELRPKKHGEGDHFGRSVTVANDTIAIGQRKLAEDGSNKSYPGRIDIFIRDETGAWVNSATIALERPENHDAVPEVLLLHDGLL